MSNNAESVGGHSVDTVNALEGETDTDVGDDAPKGLVT